MKNKILWKFLGVYIVLVLTAVIVLNFFVSLKLRDYYELKISERLANNTLLVGNILKEGLLQNNQEFIQRKTKNLAEKLKLRITVISKEGEVLGDSKKDPLLLENHGDRLEVVRALKDGLGESNRFSDTLGYNMKYVASPVKHKGNVLGITRLALSLEEVESQVRVIYRVVLLGGLVAIFFVLIIGYFMSQGIVRPITQMKEVAQALAEGDFSKRADIRTKDELGILAKSLNKMADELISKIENLKKIDKVRTDFVANVSHELKTPLTSMKGFIETLEDGAIDDKENARRFVSIIKKHTNVLSNTINDLLSLSELELGKDRLDKSNFSLKDLIEELSLGFGHTISAKNHKFEKNFSGSNFDITADKQKIEQVFVNLMDNAAKYTKEQGKITVNTVEQKDSFMVTIEDTGIGIPEEHIDRVFERFYRVDKARSRQEGGTGLGLAIVKHIVSLHRGNVAIESRINKGTKVTVSLPKA